MSTFSSKRVPKYTDEELDFDPSPENLPVNILVKKIDKYREMLCWKKYASEHARIQTSDPELEINLKNLKHFIVPQIEHLPQDEQEFILEQYAVMKSINGKISQCSKQCKAKKDQAVMGFAESSLDHHIPKIIDLFGKFHSINEVHKIIKNEYRLDVSRKTVQNLRANYLDQILAKQQEYQNKIDHIRLAHKPARLEELTWMYQHRKTAYQLSHARDEINIMRGILKDIKQEVEGDHITIHSGANLLESVQGQVNTVLKQRLAILDIILSRVAAKMGIDPNLVLYRLHNSYYAKFNGMQGLSKDEEEIIYPSSFTFDVDKLRESDQEPVEIHEAQIVDQTKLTPKQQQKFSSLKDELINRVKNKKVNFLPKNK